MTITATSKDILFSGNTVGTGGSQVANDIYNTTTGQITFGGVKNITLEDGIDGSGTIYKTGTGTLKLGGDNSNYTGIFRLQDGTVSLLNGGQYLSASDTYLSHGVQLNFMNNQMDTINFGN
jgi:autotransporter-associated beta strand protein